MLPHYVLILFIIEVFANEQCSLSNLQVGKCTLFRQCNALFQEKTSFPICGFLGLEPIICCPIDNSIAKNAIINGNSCNKSHETCKFYSKCDTLVDILWQGFAPTICGYQENEQLICCPTKKNKKVSFLSISPYFTPNYCKNTETCKLYSQCEKARSLELDEIALTICGYQGNEFVICCPIEKNETYSSTANPNFCKYKKESCKLSSKCSTVHNMQSRGTPLTTCGYQGHEKLICCPFKKSELFCVQNYEHPPPTRLYNPIEKVYRSQDASYGGVNSLTGEFPHMAALGYGTKEDIKWGCGGSLISYRHILTAAHCLHSREFGHVKFVRLGDLNLKSTTDVASPQNFIVVNKTKHPNYRSPSKYQDIAILQLDRDIEISRFVKPACLQIEVKIQKTNFKATGWGRLEYNGEMAEHLQVVALNNIDNAQCNNEYKSKSKHSLAFGIVEDWQLCAGNENADTCEGDSGGPLQVQKFDYHDWVIIGVTSFGKPCGISKSAGVYTRVSNYIDWIESIVWP